MKTIKLDDVVISNAFLSSYPSEDKVNKYRKAYEKNKQQSKYLVLDDNNVLLDGYIQYLILRENNIKEAKYIHKSDKCEDMSYRNRLTTYVYGRHANSACNKEFMWRVPYSRNHGWDNFVKKLKAGDVIYCNTKYGNAPVIVSRIEQSDLCPVEIPVRRVASKTIIHEGE